MQGPLFVDTWGWVALGHRQDQHHQRVRSIFQNIRQEGSLIYTSDYVLDEVITLLYRREVPSEASRFVDAILGSAQLGHLVIERITSPRFAAAWALRQRMLDKPLISFTDLTSFVVMQELHVSTALTQDQHFAQVGLGFQLLP